MPGKAVSRRQFRFMKGVAGGSIKAPGLSRSEAAEYVADQSPANLPERVRIEPKRNSYRRRR